jgi:signal transduction histidine kinase
MVSTPLKRSLRAKVTLGVVLPLVLILGTFTTLGYARHRKTVLANLSLLASQSGQVIESNLRHEMLESDFAGMQQHLDAVGESEEIRLLYLLDTSGRVIFAPNGEGVGTQLDNRQPTCQPCHRLPPEARPGSVVVTADSGQRVFRSMQPIENGPECAQCHGSDERLLGLLLTDISMAPMEAALAADLRANLLWWAGTILVTVLIVNFAVSRFVLRRLERLVSVMTGFGRGQMPPPLAEGPPDEISQLTSAFNEMTSAIQSREMQLRALTASLEQQVADRTAELEARNKELQQLDDMKSEFVALVSHELRAPLTTLGGGLELALQQTDTLSPGARRTLKVMQAESERLTTFVQRLLDLSRLEAGRLPIVLGPVALRPLLKRAVAVIVSDTRPVEWDLPADLPILLADEAHLEEAIRNLVDNAHKYAPPGTALHIQARQAGHHLDLSILDHGPGIPASAQERIFDRFYRGTDSGAAQDSSGWGMGLYLARRLVEAQDGKLTVRSPAWPDDAAPGAAFTITLPLDVSEE